MGAGAGAIWRPRAYIWRMVRGLNVLAVLALSFAWPSAWATEHEVNAFGAILTDCYAGGAGLECLGRMSQTCMDDQEGGHSTLGMTSCLSAEADVWDGFLNDEYKATMAWAKAADEDEAVYFPEFAKRAEALRDAQRAWIAFRDAECGLSYATWGSGSMRNIAFSDCRMQMTAERTLELRAVREGFQ